MSFSTKYKLYFYYRNYKFILFISGFLKVIIKIRSSILRNDILQAYRMYPSLLILANELK